MKSLHSQIIKKAQHGVVRVLELGPNSREVLARMVRNGELIKSKCGTGFIVNGVRR
jgi:hypothetical protein